MGEEPLKIQVKGYQAVSRGCLGCAYNGRHEHQSASCKQEVGEASSSWDGRGGQDLLTRSVLFACME